MPSRRSRVLSVALGLSVLLWAAGAVAQTPVHVTMVSHNETDNARYGLLDTESGYLAMRAAILQIAGLMTQYGAAWSHQSDWRFLEAVRRWDQGAVLNSTNGKNILRYLREDLGFEIDAHSHESEDYNYADVTWLLGDLGIPSTGVVGGFLYSPPDDTTLVDWEKFRAPLSGWRFPGFSWQAEILWGGGTVNHQGQDADVSGCWRPVDRCHFFEHDPAGNLISVGHGTLLPLLIADIASGTAPAGRLYTQSLMIFELDVVNRGQTALDDIEAQLQMVQGYVQSGQAHWTSLRGMADLWLSQYGGTPGHYPAMTSPACATSYVTELISGYLVTAPNGNDLWVEVIQPRAALYPGARFPVVVCVPGGLGAGEGNDWGYASSGIVEIHFNPEGRGALHRSEGVENHNGFVHQDDLRAVIEYADALPNRLAGATGVHTRSYGITMGAGCLGRYPELPVKYLLDIEGPDDSFVTSFEPWALDAVPGNDRHVAARNTFGHWSTYRDPSPANLAWWTEREALRYIGAVRCAYLRVQAQWDHAQPPNAAWPGFDYPPLWYPIKHTVDMINAAEAGGVPWTRVNGPAIGNPVHGTYSRETRPLCYGGTYASHPDEDLALILYLIGLDFGASDAGKEPMPAARATIRLTAAPNPFNPVTTLRYELAEAGTVELAVFDLQGRRVRTVDSGWREAGGHECVWDGRDGRGRPAPSGAYVARVQAARSDGAVKLGLCK